MLAIVIDVMMAAVRAKFDRFLDAPVLVQCCRIVLPTNYHHLVQETWHISSSFITAGPNTDSASPDDKSC